MEKNEDGGDGIEEVNEEEDEDCHSPELEAQEAKEDESASDEEALEEAVEDGYEQHENLVAIAMRAKNIFRPPGISPPVSVSKKFISHTHTNRIIVQFSCVVVVVVVSAFAFLSVTT